MFCSRRKTLLYSYFRCKNPEKGRRTRCKCFKNKNRCGTQCKCKNCSNPHGKRSADATSDSPKKITRSPRKKSFKQSRTSTFLAESGSILNKGHWSELETIVLIILSNTLRKTGLPLTDRYYHSFYELLFVHISDQGWNEKFPIRRKSIKEISFKLIHLDQHYF